MGNGWKKPDIPTCLYCTLHHGTLWHNTALFMSICFNQAELHEYYVLTWNQARAYAVYSSLTYTFLVGRYRNRYGWLLPARPGPVHITTQLGARMHTSNKERHLLQIFLFCSTYARCQCHPRSLMVDVPLFHVRVTLLRRAAAMHFVPRAVLWRETCARGGTPARYGSVSVSDSDNGSEPW
jgi:hypothetical protein